MSKGETAAEPSMDEILSSIRKIIAEDEGGAPTAAASDAAARAHGAHGRAGEIDTDAEATGEAANTGEDDDILELTEDDELTAGAAPQTARPDALEDDDGAPAAPGRTAADEILMDDDPLDVNSPPMEATPDPHAEGRAPGREAPLPTLTGDTAATMNAMTEALLDNGAATAASGALQRLSAAMTPSATLPEGDRTIEAFLADLVRPELKDWLDRHLPSLVERIVEREIKRLVRDAQPE